MVGLPWLRTLPPPRSPRWGPPTPRSTLLALYNSIYHFGGILATPGYTDPLVYTSGGNPYGVSVTAGGGGPPDADLAHARLLGRRVTTIAARLHPASAS